MQNLYDEVGSLDFRCYDEFGLNEDILMEHAALGISTYIRNNFAHNSKVIIVCGSGNNGADGIVVARQLHADYDVSIYYAKKPKSKMAILQNNRAKKIGVNECNKIKDCDVLIDSIVGTGFSGEFSETIEKTIKKMNQITAFKIACDVPSGFEFIADITLTMGALKKSLYEDCVKEFVGKIQVVNLGISRENYEKNSNWKLLDTDDLSLPYRNKKNTNKSTYGHLAVALGYKSGAAILSASAALRFGSGLVTVVGESKTQLPDSIMYATSTPRNTTALALGMGLANESEKINIGEFLDNSLPLIADADILSNKLIDRILKRDNVIITPHPKEFTQLLRNLDITDITVEKLQQNRFKYTELFCENFPYVTLVLKGSNVIIAKNNEFFINPHGSSVLAKGGSGDVLSGLIGSLLAQGYSTLEASINASLAHTKLANDYNGADFSLRPEDLVEGICNL